MENPSLVASTRSSRSKLPLRARALRWAKAPCQSHQSDKSTPGILVDSARRRRVFGGAPLETRVFELLLPLKGTVKRKSPKWRAMKGNEGKRRQGNAEA